MVLFGQIGCIWAKVVLFGRKWLYLGKMVVFGQIGSIWAKVVLFGQKWSVYLGKIVVFVIDLVFSNLVSQGKLRR